MSNLILRFFEPRTIEGQKKLVDIQTGDFFAFGNSDEQDHTKKLLTSAYAEIKIKDKENE